MKKTLTVNLNGRVFNIDEDAYQLLDKYLRNLRIHFRKEEGRDEILADFEARIEELLSDRVRLGHNVITIAEVESVIAQMGRPSDFGENEDDTTEEKAAGSKEDPFADTKKKFYRNPDDKLFAGLCAGIAAYFGWNVVIVRMIAAILVPVTSLWIVPVYLLLWLIVPEAISAEQKLEMQGRPITVENIGKVVADSVESVKRTALKGGLLAWFVDFIAAFFKVCLIGLGFVIGIPMLIALVIIILVLFGVLFGVGTGIFGGLLPWSNTTFLYMDHPALATVAGCLILMIPLIALFYTVISRIFKLKPVHPGVKWAGLILWIASIVALPFAGFRADWTQLPGRGNWDYGWHYSVDDTFLNGDGIIAERTDTLPPMHYIRIEKRLIGNIQIEQIAGDSTFLTISGDANLIHKVRAKFNAGNENTLSLSTDKHLLYRPTTPLLIRIQTPNPRGVKLYSVGNVTIAGALRGEAFSIQMEGAGKIQADSLYTNVLYVKNEGVGSVQLAGAARHTTLKLEGIGKINAAELRSDTIRAEVEGVGSIECNPVRYLNSRVDGIGSILYKAEPEAKNTRIKGLGQIHEI
jgi:phage shock protein PspC (stress-responsive transcriptional regulator)